MIGTINKKNEHPLNKGSTTRISVSQASSFKKQDSLIFISDGLPEATNSEGDLIGYDPVYNCIKQNGHLSASEQKKALLDLGSSWLGDIQNQDDITIVVVKKT